MTDRPNTPLDDAVEDLAQQFAQGLGKLASGSLLRAGILKASIGNLVLALEEEFPDQKDVLESELADQAHVLRAEARDRNARGEHDV